MNIRSIEIWGRNSFILRVSSEPRSIWKVLADQDFVGFLVPLSWREGFSLNGWSAQREDVFYLDGEQPYDVVATRRDALTVGIRRSVFDRSCAALLGAPDLQVPRRHRLIKVSPREKVHLLAILNGAFTAARAPGRDGARLALTEIHETGMIDALAAFATEVGGLEAQEFVDSRTTWQIVSRAMTALDEGPLDRTGIADLCEAAEVRKSRLHQAFVDIYGVSPGQYLIKHRLCVARERLLDMSSPPPQVKDVALQSGFPSSGRFAQSYFKMFGELPHQTLTR